MVAAAGIKGLVLLGSESPIEVLRPSFPLDEEESGPQDHPTIHVNKPASIDADKMLFIHSSRDRVIHPLQIQQLAELWGCPQRCVTLSDSASPDYSAASWADDIQHDFINKGMLRSVTNLTLEFLDSCFS